jgi:hypothetical protein
MIRTTDLLVPNLALFRVAADSPISGRPAVSERVLLSLPSCRRAICVPTVCTAPGDRGRHTACTHRLYLRRVASDTQSFSADHQSAYVLPPQLPADHVPLGNGSLFVLNNMDAHGVDSGTKNASKPRPIFRPYANGVLMESKTKALFPGSAITSFLIPDLRSFHPHGEVQRQARIAQEYTDHSLIESISESLAGLAVTPLLVLSW